MNETVLRDFQRKFGCCFVHLQPYVGELRSMLK